jgi:hypothetical protein
MPSRALLAIAFALAITTTAAAAHAKPPASIDLPADMNAHLVVSAGLAGINLQTHSLEAGAFPAGGLGLGLDFFASKPYTLGIAVAAMGSAATSETNWIKLAFLAGFARYYYAGLLWSSTRGESNWYAIGGVDVLRVATGL